MGSTAGGGVSTGVSAIQGPCAGHADAVFQKFYLGVPQGSTACAAAGSQLMHCAGRRFICQQRTQAFASK
jgi:hypothetical protein